MALAECKVLALLSLVAALFLLAHALPFRHHGSSRLRGPGAALADLLLAALDRLQGVDLVGLATRRNMVLLCHAILLLVLRDAGLLFGTSARRRRSAGTATTTSDIFVAAGGACFHSPTELSLAVVWRPRNSRAVAAAKHAAVDGTRLAALADHHPGCAAPSSTEPEQGAPHPESTKEIVIVQEQTTCIDDHHHLVAAGELDQPPAVDGKTIPSPLGFGAMVVAEETATERELPQDCGEDKDLDDMNRRFEAFIADTKQRMRLEALQQPMHVLSGITAY